MLTWVFVGCIIKVSFKDTQERRIVVNKRKLKSVIVANNDTTTSLAEFLGIARATLSAKMNEYRGAEFTQKEIQMMIDRYSLNSEDVVAIFFAEKVS